MSYELKFDRIRAIADEVLAEKGEDFVYNINPENVCMYVPLPTEERDCDTDNDDPRLTTGCLVGEILKRAGVDVEALGMGGIHAVYEAGRVRDWQTGNPVVIEADALNWLYHVQRAQDQGVSWGHAVRRADQEAIEEVE